MPLKCLPTTFTRCLGLSQPGDSSPSPGTSSRMAREMTRAGHVLPDSDEPGTSQSPIYARVRKPTRLPACAARDPAVACGEAGASSEIPNPDDYHVRFAMGRSILLTRDVDGKAHAFLNYCRHRGAEPASGCGNARRHSCPYHAWTYNSKGELVAMPHPVDIDDYTILVQNHHAEDDFRDALVDQFDLLYREASPGNGRVMAISLHPWVIGQPYRIGALEQALQHIMGHQGVWAATGSQILDAWKSQQG